MGKQMAREMVRHMSSKSSDLTSRILASVLVLLGAGSFATSRAFGQEKEAKRIFPPEVYEELDAYVTGKKKPPTPDEKARAKSLVQRFLKIKKFERTGPDVLTTLSQNPDRSTRATENEEFHTRMVMGDWRGIGRELELLSSAEASRAYDHLLTLLANPKVLLLAGDILPLAHAAPGPLKKTQLAILGKLLAQSGQTTGIPRTVLAELEEGTENLGGPDPENRLSAARLLLAANMVAEAYPYLPPLPEGEDVDPAEAADILNLHAIYHHLASGGPNSSSEAHQAWELTQRVLDLSELPEKEKEEKQDEVVDEDQEFPEEEIDPQVQKQELARALALKAERALAIQRTVDLLSQIDRITGDVWLTNLFKKKSVRAREILADLASRLGNSLKTPMAEARLGNIELMRRAVARLLETNPGEQWGSFLDLLTLSWIEEVQHTLNTGPSLAPTIQSPQWHAYQAFQKLILDRKKKKIIAIEAKKLLPCSPDEDWFAALQPDLSRKVRRMHGLLLAELQEGDEVFSHIQQELNRDPELAKELAQRMIVSFTRSLGKRPNYGQNNNRIYYSGSSTFYPSRTQAIPLTRSKQVRQLHKLAELLTRLSEIGAPVTDPGTIVTAFSSCHSPAEIYREEDILAVFGPLAEIPIDTTLGLIAAMRLKLSGQWRKMDTQKNADTKRTDKELIAEVRRGYEVCCQVLENACEEDPGDYRVPLALAPVYFDQAEFLYGQKEDLATYTSIRNKSFSNYRLAADLYRETISEIGKSEQNSQVYRQWFQSALGASDLTYLTRQDQPDMDEVEQIGLALRALPEDVIDHHLNHFGTSLTSGINNLPAQLRPHFFRQGLKVLGDHPSGKDALELLTFYDELLSELELAVIVEGSADVGSLPFGAHFVLRHTRATGRESGGFGKYFRNKVYNYQARTQVDYRDDLEEHIREVMSEGFELLSLTFHESNVEPRGFGRLDWRETPMAYLVMKARDPSVDRIPSLKLSLEFNDGKGTVLLPIISSVVLISARSSEPIPRPTSEVEICQVLDDRELASDGILRLEVTAKGNGILPDLDQLIDLGGLVANGFTPGEIQDQGLNVNSLDTDGDTIQAQTDRSWLVALHSNDQSQSNSFAFPSSSDESAAMKFQQYADADIIDVEGDVALAGLRLQSTASRSWIMAGIFSGLIAMGLFLYQRKKKRALTPDKPRYQRLNTPTPFSCIGLLKRISSDDSVQLSDAERRELATAIFDLERRFFAPAGEGKESSCDLGALMDRWITAASRVA